MTLYYTNFPQKTTRSSAKNPCPVCQKTHGCLINESVVTCIRNPSDPPTGWRFVKEARNGMGGVFVSTNAQRISSSVSPTGIEEKRHTISDSELNRTYRLIANQRELATRHRRQLQQRGLDGGVIDRLAALGFYSHLPNGRVEGVNRNDIPGVSGDRLKGSNGFFIPAYTATGDIVGGQIATGKRKGAKYLYLKGATKIREKEGTLQFVATPSFRRSHITLPTATLHLSISRRGNGREETGIGAALVDSIGNIIDSGGKHFDRQFPLQAEYNALLYGIQIALRAGIENLTIANASPELRQQLRDRPAPNPEIKLLHRVILEALDAQTDYEFSEGGSHTIAANAAARALAGQTDDRKTFDFRDVWLVDGALKAWLTAELHGVAAIGCPGGQHAYSPDLRPNLRAIDPETVSHMPDAGDVINEAQIPKINRDLHKAIESLGYRCRVGWWGQQTKDEPDIDEIAPDTLDLKWLAPDEFFELHPEKIKAGIDRRIFRPGIHKVDEPASPPRSEITPRQPIKFEEGNRLNTVRSLIASGNRYIHDRSAAGSGKSFDFGTWTADDFGVYQLLHVTNEPLTTDPHFAGWEQYRGRDNGRTVRPDGRVVKAEKGTPEENKLKPSNCARWEFNDYLVERKITPSVDRICLGCKFAAECKSTSGWYQHDRKVALAKRKTRIHPGSLGAEILRAADGKLWKDAKPDNRQPGTVVVLDDVDPWVANTSVSIDEIANFQSEHDTLLESLPTLRKALVALKALLKSKSGQTLQHAQIIDRLPKIEEAENVLRSLYELEAYEIENAFENGDRANELGGLWVEPFVEAMSGNGHLYTYQGGLHIVQKNKRFLEALKHPAVKAVVVADATGRAEYYEKWLGCTTKIPTIAQKPPEQTAKLELTQITGLGDLGYRRTDRQRAKLGQLKKAIAKQYPDFAAIEIKGEIKSDDFENVALSWRSTSRGSNAAKDKPGLVVYGTPRANLSALYARFSLMTGAEPGTEEALALYPMRWQNRDGHWVRALKESTSPAFAEFCRRETLAEIEQGFARLRAVRRPGEVLTVLMISEYPLDVPCDAIDIDEFLGMPAPKKTATTIDENEIELGAMAIAASGDKLTQETLGEFIGVSRNTIAEFFARPGRDWKVFKKARNVDTVGTSRFVEPPPTLYKGDSTKAEVPTIQGFQPTNTAETHDSDEPLEKDTHDSPEISENEPLDEPINEGDRVFCVTDKGEVTGTVTLIDSSSGFALVEIVDSPIPLAIPVNKIRKQK